MIIHLNSSSEEFGNDPGNFGMIWTPKRPDLNRSRELNLKVEARVSVLRSRSATRVAI